MLIEEDLIERSRVLGDRFLERVRAIDSPHVAEVRGRGLWLGVELRPEAGGARRFCEALEGEGILCKETHVNTIRFAPPLVITDAELDDALATIAKVLA